MMKWQLFYICSTSLKYGDMMSLSNKLFFSDEETSPLFTKSFLIKENSWYSFTPVEYIGKVCSSHIEEGKQGGI